jgi:hypothetical protein
VGCSTRQTIKADIYIRIHEDHSGSYQLIILGDPLAIPMTKFLQERLQEQGFTIQELNQGNKSGWKAQKKVKNIQPSSSALNEILDTNPSQEKQTMAQSKNGFLQKYLKVHESKTEEAFFWKKISLHYDVDLTQIDRELPLQNFSKFFYDRVDLDFHLTLPLEPEHHNAAKVSKDGKTLSWPLKLGKHNSMVLSIDLPNPLGWIVSGIALLLLIIALSMVLYRKKRKSSRKPED